MKRWLTLIILMLFALSVPALARAEKSVQKLKGPFKHYLEYNNVIEDIINQGSLATPDLIALLKEQAPKKDVDAKKQWDAKVTAMNILSEIKAQDALPILKDMLETSDSLSAINNAARSIGRIGGNNAYKILEDVYAGARNYRYEQNDERLRAVIAGLGLCGNKKAVSLLTEALQDSDNDEIIRIYAAGSLGLLGSREGLNVAADELNSEDPYVRLAAVRALGLIESDAAIPALKKLARPEVDYVFRKSAQLSITQIEAARLSEDNKIGYIKQQLVTHPHITEFIQWGTLKLKQMNSPKAQKALEDLTVDDSPDFKALRHAAKIRAKTMK